MYDGVSGWVSKGEVRIYRYGLVCLSDFHDRIYVFVSMHVTSSTVMIYE